jgi:soluble lytic murein transglycosylase-like protein
MVKLTSQFAAASLLLTATAPARADPVSRWAHAIAEAASRFDLPKKWIRDVMRIESGGVALNEGRPLVSAAGAMGLMQLMPATWHDMQDQLRLGSDPFDPHDNIIAGSAYLRRMYDRFGYPGMFAAYNLGPKRYAAVLLGHPLPSETRTYVNRITRMEMKSRLGLMERTSISFPVGWELRAAKGVETSNGLFIELARIAPPADGRDNGGGGLSH